MARRRLIIVSLLTMMLVMSILDLYLRISRNYLIIDNVYFMSSMFSALITILLLAVEIFATWILLILIGIYLIYSNIRFNILSSSSSTSHLGYVSRYVLGNSSNSNDISSNNMLYTHLSRFVDYDINNNSKVVSILDIAVEVIVSGCALWIIIREFYLLGRWIRSIRTRSY